MLSLNRLLILIFYDKMIRHSEYNTISYSTNKWSRHNTATLNASAIIAVDMIVTLTSDL